MRGKAALATLAAIALLCGCRPGAAKFAYKPLPPAGWDAAESVTFPVDSVPADGFYVLTVGLRTSAARPYPYRSVTLRVSTRIPDTAQERTKELALPLADTWGDTGGSGTTLFQYEQTADTLQLRGGQRGTIRIAHAMRDRLLTGITDIGIRLERLGTEQRKATSNSTHTWN
ncbi:MAG: gliding motility lipoprotein GldH [Alloprevotella sp.]|nr:gliding motility lipoprotein GldH [Alloprevotella sp.]